jgi:hypothetical protein
MKKQMFVHFFQFFLLKKQISLYNEERRLGVLSGLETHVVLLLHQTMGTKLQIASLKKDICDSHLFLNSSDALLPAKLILRGLSF